LCKLAAGRLTPEAPPLELPKATISRLRRALARAAKRARVNDELILTVGKKVFVLVLSDGIARHETLRNLLLCDWGQKRCQEPFIRKIGGRNRAKGS
jgi:hypothetical protein